MIIRSNHLSSGVADVCLLIFPVVFYFQFCQQCGRHVLYTVFAQVLYDECIVNKLELSMEIIDDNVIPYSWAGLFNEEPLT